MAVRSAKQKAALRKAQLASAKKRKRHALVRNVGRGVAGKKNGSRKRRYKVARYAGGLAAAGAVAYGAHKARQYDVKASIVKSAKYDRHHSSAKRASIKAHNLSKSPVGGRLVGGHVHAKGHDYRFMVHATKKKKR